VAADLSSLRRWASSVRGKLILSVALVHAVMMSLFVVDLVQRQQAFLIEMRTEEGRSLAKTLSLSSITPMLSSDLAALQEVAVAIGRYPGVAHVMVVHASGLVLAHSDPLLRGKYLTDLPASGSAAPNDLTVLHRDAALVDVLAPVQASGRLLGWTRVGIGQSSTHSRLEAITLDGMAYTALAIVLGAVLAWYLGRRLTQRLDQLQQATDSVTRGVLNQRAPEHDDEVGQLGRAFNVMIDSLSAREAALAASQSEVRKLAQTVEQSPEAILICDDKRRIEYVNDALIQLVGFERDELIGRDVNLLKSGRTPQDVYRSLEAALAQETAWRGEFINRRRDGSEYVALTVVAPLRDAQGRVSHHVSVQVDVTEQKAMMQELQAHRLHLETLVERRTDELARAKSAAEAANVAKSAFLANMSHEIRTPLNGILGNAYLLQQQIGQQPEATLLSRITTSGRHLLSVINDVLDISKIEAGHFDLDRVLFSLSDVVDTTLTVVNHGADKGLLVQCELAGLPQLLWGDPTRLSQALVNYLANAIKFTEQGAIVLRGLIERESDAQVWLRFEVQDTGVGIDPAQQQHLFKAFEQADNSLSRRFGGTGLGLAITRHIAERMGGEVGVRSQLGQGSTFWFTACFDKPAATAVPAPPLATLHAGQRLREAHFGRRVLLVEDDAVNQEVARAIVEAVGLQVDIAIHGQQAVDLVRQHDYAAVLMDVQMPGMDGLEATRLIRALPGRASLPVLALSANAFSEDRRACLDAGMSDFLGKPFTPEALYAALLRALAG